LPDKIQNYKSGTPRLSKDQTKIQQEVKMMVETQQMSAGAMIGLAIILGILLWLFPWLLIWIAWFAIILLFIGGLAALFTR
jgi:ABC-type bacteriocin/lantibiotic exporter with double-glycine peptidase domain